MRLLFVLASAKKVSLNFQPSLPIHKRIELVSKKNKLVSAQRHILLSSSSQGELKRVYQRRHIVIIVNKKEGKVRFAHSTKCKFIFKALPFPFFFTRLSQRSQSGKSLEENLLRRINKKVSEVSGNKTAFFSIIFTTLMTLIHIKTGGKICFISRTFSSHSQAPLT